MTRKFLTSIEISDAWVEFQRGHHFNQMSFGKFIMENYLSDYNWPAMESLREFRDALALMSSLEVFIEGLGDSLFRDVDPPVLRV